MVRAYPLILVIGLSAIVPGAALAQTSQPMQQKMQQPQMQRQKAPLQIAQKPVDWGALPQQAMTAVSRAIDAWSAAASLTATSFSPTGAVTSRPGSLRSSVDITDAIRRNFDAGVPADIAGAFSRAVGSAWNAWAADYRLAMIPWYPIQPIYLGHINNMYNIPTPVGLGISPNGSRLARATLAAAIRSELGARANDSGAGAAIDDFSSRVESGFIAWQLDTLATSCALTGFGHLMPAAPAPTPIPSEGAVTCSPGFLLGPGFRNSARVGQEAAATLGRYSVRLTAGQGDRTPETLTLRGTLEFTRSGYAQARLTVRDATLTLARGGSAVAAGAQANPARAVSTAAVANAAAQTVDGAGSWAYTRASGTGTMELQVGSTTLTFPHALIGELKERPDGGLAVTMRTNGGLCAGDVSLALGASDVQISQSGRCNGYEEARAIRLTASGLAGNATVRAFGKTATAALAVEGGKLKTRGALALESRGWLGMPNIGGLQMLVHNPRVNFEFTEPATPVQNLSSILEGTRAAFSLGVDKVEVRTTANDPSGKPWASASLVPPAVQLYVDGSLNVPMPKLPRPQAPLPTVSQAYCDATCGVVRNLNLGLAAAVPSGTPVPPLGHLKHVNEWRSECEIWSYGASAGNGRCKSLSTCPPGQTYFQGNDGKWNCRTNVVPPPTIPSLPAKVPMKLEALVR